MKENVAPVIPCALLVLFATFFVVSLGGALEALRGSDFKSLVMTAATLAATGSMAFHLAKRKLYLYLIVGLLMAIILGGFYLFM